MGILSKTWSNFENFLPFWGTIGWIENYFKEFWDNISKVGVNFKVKFESLKSKMTRVQKTKFSGNEKLIYSWKSASTLTKFRHMLVGGEADILRKFEGIRTWRAAVRGILMSSTCVQIKVGKNYCFRNCELFTKNFEMFHNFLKIF